MLLVNSIDFGLLFNRILLQIYAFSGNFKTRRAYCTISLLNYSIDLMLISWMTTTTTSTDVLFCVSSALVGISTTALYLRRPAVMLPDVLFKAAVSFAAFFRAVVEIDANGADDPLVVRRFFLVAFAVLTHFYENYFLFNAIAAFYREQEGLIAIHPPPSYRLFAKEEHVLSSPPTYAEAIEMRKNLDIYVI